MTYAAFLSFSTAAIPWTHAVSLGASAGRRRFSYISRDIDERWPLGMINARQVTYLVDFADADSVDTFTRHFRDRSADITLLIGISLDAKFNFAITSASFSLRA